ncbi:MAG: hypothetical protein ACMG6E_09680 [Candidatus Roizmanbacteria bacterium]
MVPLEAFGLIYQAVAVLLLGQLEGVNVCIVLELGVLLELRVLPIEDVVLMVRVVAGQLGQEAKLALLGALSLFYALQLLV